MLLQAELLIKGCIIGFAMAAPVGPIGVLCIRRTLTMGIFSGLATGLGAAVADAVYGAVAAFGMVMISTFLSLIGPYMQFFGSLFLLVMGFRIFRTKPTLTAPVTDEEKQRHNIRQLIGDFGSSVFLTLTNPATILAFIAVFASLGVTGDGSVVEGTGAEADVLQMQAMQAAHAGWLVAGVFAGSMLWWGILTGGIGVLRHRLDRKTLRAVNRISGMLIGGFGAAILGRLVVAKLMAMF